MIRADWDDWRKAPTAKKLAALVAAHERLVQKVVESLMQRLPNGSESLREDVTQGVTIGLLRAIRGWKPNKGAFSTVAWQWMRFEGQLVMRHAAPVSFPRDLIFCAPERPTEAFVAKNGRNPEPDEVTGDTFVLARRERLQANFVPVSAAENMTNTDDADIEEDIDRQRDMKALKLFLGKLTKVERERFWTGKDDNLTARAKAFVAGKRGTR